MSQVDHAQPAEGASRIEEIRQVMTSSLSRKWLLALIFLTTILLTAGYLIGKLWIQAPVVFLIGLLWGVCVLRNIRWVASLLFTIMLAVAVVGYLARLSHILMLAAGCTSVITWDLHYFEGRLLDLDEPATREMEKNHLQRSLLALLFSFIIIAVDSLLHIRVIFIELVFLTVVVILVLNQIMIMARNANKPAPPKQ